MTPPHPQEDEVDDRMSQTERSFSLNRPERSFILAPESILDSSDRHEPSVVERFDGTQSHANEPDCIGLSRGANGSPHDPSTQSGCPSKGAT